MNFAQFFQAPKSLKPYLKFAALQVIIFVFSLLLLGLLRYIYILINDISKLNASLADIARAFLVGARFDASIAAYILILSILTSLVFVFNKPKISKTLFLFCCFTLLGVVASLSVGDIFYSQSAGKRLTYEVELIFTSQIFNLTYTAIYEHYGWILFFIILGFISFIFLKKIIKNISFNLQFCLLSLLFVVLNLGVLTVVARGGLQRVPLRIGDAMISNNKALNDIIPPSVFMVLNSINKSNKTVDFMPTPQAIKLVQQHIGSGYLNAKYPMMRHHQANNTVKKPNVILIFLESWSAKMLNDPALQKFSPNFQKLKSQGMYFDNFYAAGTRSANGLFALLTGYPDTVDGSMLSKPELNSNFYSISDIFKDHDYKTRFFTGGELDYDNLKGLLTQESFDEYFGIESINQQGKNFPWGAADEVMFDFAYNNLSKIQQPFFAMLFTTSTHPPFQIPQDFDRSQLQQLGVDKTGIQQDFLSSLYYSDQQIGAFLQKLNKAKLLENTLIIMLADHTHHMGLNAAEGFEIPMLWWSKNMQLPYRQVHSIGSQYDILTTLFNFLNWDYTNASMGKNLLDLNNPANQFSYFRSNQIHARYQDIYAVQNLDKTSAVLFYDYKNMLPITKNQHNQQQLENITTLMQAYYQTSSQILLHNQANSSLKNH